MSSLIRHSVTLLPLMSILSLAPVDLEHKFAHRDIASVKAQKEKSFPNYEKFAVGLDKKKLELVEGPNYDKLKAKSIELRDSLIKEEKEFKKDLKEQKEVAAQKDRIEKLVSEIASLEESANKIELDSAQKKSFNKDLVASKTIAEVLLTNLDKNIELSGLNAKKEEKVEVAKVEEKVEEKDKKSEQPSSAENKVEHKCDYSEQNLVLSKKVDELVQNYNNILQTFMGFAQMMVGMNRNPYEYRGPAVSPREIYPYAAPTTSGSWVYYPNGFQPGQQPMQNNYSSYPDQLNQQQQMQNQAPIMNNNWSLAPQMSFDPRFAPMQMQPAPFGNSSFGYDFTPMTQNMAPQLPTNFI